MSSYTFDLATPWHSVVARRLNMQMFAVDRREWRCSCTWVAVSMQDLSPRIMVFKIANRSYQIRNLQDSVPGVMYWFSARARMDTDLFWQLVDEPRIFKPFTHRRIPILFLDSCTSHALSASLSQSLAPSRVELQIFPELATDLVQPAFFFVMQAIKARWKKRWNAEVLRLIALKMWTDQQECSGRVVSPGESNFLKPSSLFVRHVSEMSDRVEVLLVWREKICCDKGFTLNVL